MFLIYGCFHFFKITHLRKLTFKHWATTKRRINFKFNHTGIYCFWCLKLKMHGLGEIINMYIFPMSNYSENFKFIISEDCEISQREVLRKSSVIHSSNNFATCLSLLLHLKFKYILSHFDFYFLSFFHSFLLD